MSTVVVAMSTVAVISLMYVVYLSVVYFCMFLYITATRLSGIFMLQLQVFFFFFLSSTLLILFRYVCDSVTRDGR